MTKISQLAMPLLIYIDLSLPAFCSATWQMNRNDHLQWSSLISLIPHKESHNIQQLVMGLVMCETQLINCLTLPSLCNSFGDSFILSSDKISHLEIVLINSMRGWFINIPRIGVFLWKQLEGREGQLICPDSLKPREECGLLLLGRYNSSPAMIDGKISNCE